MTNERFQQPLVSVITAVKNGEQYIEDAILSVFRQSHRNIEYIVIDSCSTDNTNSIIEKHKNGISKHISEPDAGISDAWNKGIRMSSGEFIALLNADDFYSPDFLAESLKCLQDAPNCISYGDTVFINPEDNSSSLLKGAFSKDRLGRGFGFMHTSCLVPRSVYECYGNFDPSYKIGMDTEFLLRCVSEGVQLKYSGATNYMREGGVSSKFINRARSEYRSSLKKYGFYRKQWHQDWMQTFSLRVQALLGSRRKSYLKSQARFAILRAFTILFNNCCSHPLRRLLLRKTGCAIGKRSVIHPKCTFFSMGRLKIGSDTVICRDCYLDNRHPIHFGDNVMLAHGCKVYTTGHSIDCPYFSGTGKPVTLNDRVVLFSNVTVMPGVTMGEGSVALPNAVITRDVGPYEVVGGNPARLIRERSRDLRYTLNYSEYFAL